MFAFATRSVSGVREPLIPIRIRPGAGEMAVQIGGTVFPPDRTALAESNFRAIDRVMGCRLRRAIAAPLGNAGRAAGGHQFVDKAFAHTGFECRTAYPP